MMPFRFGVFVFACSLHAQLASALRLDKPEVYLWPGDAPGSEGVRAESEWMPGTDGMHRLHNIHRPLMIVFVPEASRANGTAFVICPSGGHTHLTMDPEVDRARELNNMGVAAFVLEYRLALTPGFHYKVDVESLQDAQRAVRTIRSRAREWHIDPDKIGIMGASAGGEIAALVSTRYDDGNAAAHDGIDRLPSKVNSAVLISAALTEMELDIRKTPPPTFIIVANDDRLSRPAAEYYLALKKLSVPMEMHIFARGGHSLGSVGIPAGAPPLPVVRWSALLKDWMLDTGIISR